MGTVSPNPFISENEMVNLKEDILDPFIKGLQKDNIDYRGVIFIGLMIENNKAKVLELNVRFGDPETQSILLRLDSDLYEIMDTVSKKEVDQIEDYALKVSTNPMFDKTSTKWHFVLLGRDFDSYVDFWYKIVTE